MQFQKISTLPSQKGLGFPRRGEGGYVRPKNLKKCKKLTWNFHRGGRGGGLEKNRPWGWYEYFLELDIHFSDEMLHFLPSYIIQIKKVNKLEGAWYRLGIIFKNSLTNMF